MNNPVKVAIVGMGGIGHTHARCYMSDGLAELVACCDVIQEKADEAAKMYNCKAFYSLKEMLNAMPEIDVVDVTTSGYEQGSLHFEPAMQALDMGKNVLVEKPLCADIRDARTLVKFAAEKDLYLGCNLNHYFSKPAYMADKLIADNKVGEQVYCINKVGFNGSSSSYGGVGSPRWRTPYSHAKAFLVHPFSVMRHYCGNVTHIQAFMDKTGVRKTAGDLMLSVQSIHMKFENGCIGYLLSQRGDAMFGLGGWWSFELAGTNGTFVIENCVEKLTYFENGHEPVVTDTGITDFNDTFPKRIHAYLEDITNGVPKEYLRSSGRDALAALEYINAAINSYESGGETVRPEPLPPLHGTVGYVW